MPAEMESSFSAVRSSNEVVLPNDAVSSSNIDLNFVKSRTGDFTHLTSLTGSSLVSTLQQREQPGEYTHLHWMALHGDATAIDAVLSKVTSSMKDMTRVSEMINARAENMQTPLMWAAIRGHNAVINILVKKFGAKVDLVDNLGASAMLLAVQHGQADSLVLLRSLWQDGILLGDCNGCTPAHWAAYRGDQFVLVMLHHWDPNSVSRVDNLGNSPLHLSVSGRQTACLQFLVSVLPTSFLHAKNQQGETPISLCRDDIGNRVAIVAGLRSAGLKPVNIRKYFDDSEYLLSEMKDDGKESQATKPKSCSGCKLHSAGGVSPVYRPVKVKTGSGWAMPAVFMTCTASVIYSHLTVIQGKENGSSAFEGPSDLYPESLYPGDLYPGNRLWYATLVVSLLGLVFFVMSVFADPGRVPRPQKHETAIERLEIQIRKEAECVTAKDAIGGQMLDELRHKRIERICTTCIAFKDLRTKHCRTCNSCVTEFDHHCVWINNCVGQGNHRVFILAVFFIDVAAALHLYSSVRFMWQSSVNVLTSCNGLIDCSVFHVSSFPILAFSLLACLLVAPWLAILLAYQLRVIASNMYTNEQMNLKRYGHFWDTTGKFRNPFSRGIVLNWISFWFRPWTAHRRDGYESIELRRVE